MRRIAILIDGTWNKEGEGADTNVAKLDAGKQTVTATLIKPTAAGEIPQTVSKQAVEFLFANGIALARVVFELSPI
jgi:hypothetical protein